MKTIKCIACDLDGTIVKEDNTISQVTLDTIEQAIARGILFLLCTGRGYSDMQGAFSRILKLPCILLNGAMFMNAQGVMCVSFAMHKQSVAMVEKQLLYNHMPCIYFTHKNIYGCGDLNCLKRCVETYYPTMEQQTYFSAPVLPVTSYVDIKEDILKMETMLVHYETIKETRRALQNIDDLQVASSLPFNIEITAQSVNKATMLTQVLERYGIQKEDVLYFGDSDNDIEVFQTFPNTIAPENANTQIKQLASDYCESCEGDGVALYIKKKLSQIA